MEFRFTYEQVGLLYHLAKKEQIASEKRQAEMTAAQLAKVLAPVFQSFSQGVVM